MRKGFTLTFLAFLLVTSLSAQELAITFSVNSPDNIARDYEIGLASADFGFQFVDGDNFVAELAWGYAFTDSTQVATDSLMCTTGPVANPDEIAGKIALVRRGACFFSDKVYQAQLGGAIGAIICNSNPDEGVITMGAGGDFAGLDTIPSAFLSFEDCAILAEVLSAGETIEAEFDASIATFLSPATAFSYHTPESQIIPLNAMNITLANPSADEAVEAMSTATITDPTGAVTELMVSAMLAPASDTVLFFPDYVPAGGIGTYTVDFTSNLSEEVLSQPFVITEFTFAPDNGEITGGIGPSDANFVDVYNLTYNSGSLSYMGENGGIATHATFGIENAAALFSGDAAGDVINVVVYQGDADGDGIVDLQNSFDDLIPVALGEYVLTGEEGVDQLLDVALTSLEGDEGIALEPNQPYYTTIQYSGFISGLGVAPQFLGTRSPNYPSIVANQNLTTPLFLDQLYTGWTGSTLVTRLQMEGYVPSTGVNTFEVLEEAKLSLSPNPATDFVNVEFAFETQTSDVRLRLLNIEGRLLQSVELDNLLNDTYRLDVNDLPNGTYILSVATPEGMSARKVIIAR